MANTRATIKTRTAQFGLLALGTVLACCALIYMTGGFTPAANTNAMIVDEITRVSALPPDQQQPAFKKLGVLQARVLAAKPSEPFAWARLSYLRHVTGQSEAEAFDALRMSDLVSPYEVQQLPERSAAWLRFAKVQTSAQQDYQDMLWTKAFKLAPDPTWDLVTNLQLSKYVGEAISRKDKDVAAGWYGRMREHGMPY